MRYIDPAIFFGGLVANPVLDLNAGTLTKLLTLQT